MTKYTIERIILAFVTTCIILTITFFLLKILPFQQPAATTEEGVIAYYTTQVKLGYVLDFSTIQETLGTYLYKYTDTAKETHYFYIRPVGDQYIAWIEGIFTEWNWGVSSTIKPNYSAMGIIFGKLPYTIKVNIWSVIISVPTGIILGIWAALKKNKLTDHIISTLVMVFISIPSFITITFLLLIFGYNGKLLPTQWPSDSASLSTRVLGYIIPVMSLSFGSICGYCRFTRAELTEVMSSDYLLLARTKGLTKTQTVIRHALRNAMVPILPSILSEFIGILGGSMILESLYGIPGIGALYITALSSKDYNVLLVDMAFFTVISLVAGVFLDLSYGFIDPRIRMGGKK
ncbi:MAG: ABC transporter permease [Bacilli bacterium]